MDTSGPLDVSLAQNMFYQATLKGIKLFNEIDWFDVGLSTLITSLTKKEVRFRTLMFVQVFYRCYGGDHDPYDVRLVAEHANTHLAGLLHLNPSELEVWFKAGKIGLSIKLTNNPFYINPMPQGLGVDMLVWKCNNTFRGRFTWASGRTAPFTNWLKTNAAIAPAAMSDIVVSDAISCWEGVFYAMIKTGTMEIAPVHQAYEDSVLGTTSTACLKMLNVMLGQKNRVLERIDMKDTNYAHQRFTAGDILLIPGGSSDTDASSVLHHVVLVVANTGPAGPDSTEIFHLWGNGGSNFCDIARLGEFNGVPATVGLKARFFRCHLL